jgi:hypothetical protein
MIEKLLFYSCPEIYDGKCRNRLNKTNLFFSHFRKMSRKFSSEIFAKSKNKFLRKYGKRKFRFNSMPAFSGGGGEGGMRDICAILVDQLGIVPELWLKDNIVAKTFVFQIYRGNFLTKCCCICFTFLQDDKIFSFS